MQFQYKSFCTGSKNLKISVILGPKKVKPIEKLSYLVHFDYFSLEAWFFSIMCLNFQKDTLKNKVLNFLNCGTLF